MDLADSGAMPLHPNITHVGTCARKQRRGTTWIHACMLSHTLHIVWLVQQEWEKEARANNNGEIGHVSLAPWPRNIEISGGRSASSTGSSAIRTFHTTGDITVGLSLGVCAIGLQNDVHCRFYMKAKASVALARSFAIIDSFTFYTNDRSGWRQRRTKLTASLPSTRSTRATRATTSPMSTARGSKRARQIALFGKDWAAHL